MSDFVDKKTFTQGAEFAGPLVLSDGARLQGNTGKGGVSTTITTVGAAAGTVAITVDGVELHILAYTPT